MIQERPVHRDVFGAPSPGSADAGVPISCPACSGLALIHPDVTGFHCRSCGTDNLFCECTHCGTGAVVSLPHGQPLTRWNCPACESRNVPPLFGRMPVLTALDVQASADARRRLGDRERSVTLTDLEVLASGRAELPIGVKCSVTVLDHGITLRRTDIPAGVTYLYDELDVIEINGRANGRGQRARSRQIRSGASLVSLAGERTQRNDAVVRLGSGDERVVLAHPTLTRDELRSALAMMLTRWEDAHRAARLVRRPLIRRSA